MTIAAGARLGPYEIRSLLGAGGMGEVYRATDPRLARDVALKVLPPEVASDPARIERFRREARAVAALNHPGIVTIHLVEESGGVHFLTMELVILHELATGQRPFRGDSPAELVARILRDTPAALTDLRPDLPPGLARLVRLCLEKEPQRRCRSALELRDELEGLRTEVRDSAGRVRPDDAALRTPSGRRISAIAVLPLSNLSREPEEEYFADGMTDALITDLAKATRLRVISRGSVMRYRETTKSPGEIAAELRVDALVEGSVFRAGDRVRISARLISVGTDEHLWAERYDRKLEDPDQLLVRRLPLGHRVLRARTRPPRTCRGAGPALPPRARDARLELLLRAAL